MRGVGDVEGAGRRAWRDVDGTQTGRRQKDDDVLAVVAIEVVNERGGDRSENRGEMRLGSVAES